MYILAEDGVLTLNILIWDILYHNTWSIVSTCISIYVGISTHTNAWALEIFSYVWVRNDYNIAVWWSNTKSNQK